MRITIGNLELSAVIKAKSNSIKNKVTNTFLEEDAFKRFYSTLNTIYRNHNISDIAIFIAKDELLQIDSQLKDQINNLFKSNDIRGKHYFWVNRKIELTKAERKTLFNNNAIRNFFKTESEQYCVFYLSKDRGIHYFLDGEDTGEAIFFTSTEQAKFNQLLPINEIEQIFDNYRIHLEERNTYSKFFVPNSGKRSLAKHLNPTISKNTQYKLFQQLHKQLLNNKPEDHFRDDLKAYLDHHLAAVSISIEYLLKNYRRLDISIVDELGEKYLIEVKWVGTSIHANGDHIGITYDHKSINPAAVIQTVQYIEQLHKENKNIKIAFLAVFDARDGQNSDTVTNFDPSKLSSSENKYYPQFRKINDFIVKNIHPK